MWLSTQFEAHLEKAYQNDLLEEKVRLARMIAVLALIFNASFYLLDRFTLASALGYVDNIRIVMMLVPIAVLGATYLANFGRYYTVAMCCGLGMLGLCIIALIHVAGPADIAANSYYVGLIMVSIAMHMLTFVPLSAAVFVTLLLLTTYISVALGKPVFSETGGLALLATNLFFFASTTTIAIVGQVLRDRYKRDNFVLRNSLQRDIEVKEERRRLASYLAEHDALTGLPNRLRFERKSQQILDACRSTSSLAVVYFIDLDNFKPVNDEHGHAAGDRVLKKIAERLERVRDEKAIIGRLGGDEFVICMPIQDEDGLESVAYHAARFASAIQRGIEVRGKPVHLTASIGAAAYPLDGDELESVVEVADAQMYRAKSVKGEIHLSAGIEQRLRGAVNADGFDLSRWVPAESI